MSIDAILSQVTGGLNWSSLSWEILLRALLILLVGIIFNKLLLRTVDRLLLRSASLAPIQRYLRPPCLSCSGWCSFWWCWALWAWR